MSEEFPEGHATCVRCLESKDLMELDRLLWCEECRWAARERAAWWGWAQGLGFGALVAAYVFLVVRPTDLILSAWVATVVAAVWIGARIGREIAYGVMRYVSASTLDTSPASPSSPAGGGG